MIWVLPLGRLACWNNRISQNLILTSFRSWQWPGWGTQSEEEGEQAQGEGEEENGQGEKEEVGATIWARGSWHIQYGYMQSW